MPTNGLSLVGFMAEDAALNHLKIACVPNAGVDDAALLVDHAAAQKKLGPPTQNAGACQSAIIPPTHPHIQALLTGHHAQGAHAMLASGADFRWIEVDPLLAFQHTVDLDRSAHHCHVMTGQPPTEDELFKVCLPLEQTSDSYHGSVLETSAVIRSRSLNLNIVSHGGLPGGGVGIMFGWTLPFVHVVEYQGRAVLYNGYHRTIGSRLAGATRVPCVFRKVNTAQEASFKEDGSTFSEKVMMSENPPTISHYTQDRSFPVRLRAATRIIAINWSQHTLFEE